MVKKKTVTHKGVTAEIENTTNEHQETKRTQKQPPAEKFFTTSLIEAETLVNMGAVLKETLSPFQGKPKRYVFDATPEEIEKIRKGGGK